MANPRNHSDGFAHKMGPKNLGQGQNSCSQHSKCVTYQPMCAAQFLRKTASSVVMILEIHTHSIAVATQ